MCVFFGSFSICLSVLSYPGLSVFVFYYCYLPDACFLTRDRKSVDLDGSGVEEWRVVEKLRKGNHNQNILYEKLVLIK